MVMATYFYSEFTSDVSSGSSPLTVSFLDASDSSSGPATSWGWTFGDGSTSTDQNPIHTFVSSGTFTVTLVIPDWETMVEHDIVVTAPSAYGGYIVKVQGGLIKFCATDTLTDVEFNVLGNMAVSTALRVGNEPLINGLITTPDGADTDLLITTGGNGTLKLHQNASGTLTLNNVQWPAAEIQPGMYIGASGLNTLEYATLELAALADVNLTSPVEGNVMTYTAGAWTNALPSGGGGGGTTDETFVVQLTALYNGDMYGYMYSAWDAFVINSTTNASWDAYMSELILDEIGAWKITVQVTASPDGPWPQDATTYGTYVSSAVYQYEKSQYFRGAGFWDNLQISDQTARWSDEFIVPATTTVFSVPIAVFAESYDAPTTLMTFTAMVTATKLNGTFTPPPELA
jgi:hypothetical protein